MEGDQLLQPEEIEEQFHEEAGLYYTPFCQENDVRINASGKLWERYNLVKKFLRDGRILKSTPQREKISKTSSLPADETIIEKLKWLETNFQPFDQVEQYWIDTFDERRNSLIQQKDKNESVYSKFECLKNENAVTLIHLDFKKILPSASDEHIEEYWPYLCRFIREYSKIDEQLYSNAVAQNLISLLAEEPDDNNGVLILLLLAHMLKSTSIKPAAPKKSGKKRKNLSGDTPPQKKNDKSEQLKEPDFVNDFLAIVKIDSQINERVEEKKRVAAQQKKTVQPYMLFVGGPEKCTSFYVIIDDYKYKVDNPLNALKLNFELFFLRKLRISGVMLQYLDIHPEIFIQDIDCWQQIPSKNKKNDRIHQV